jgi:hypothetical protein
MKSVEMTGIPSGGSVIGLHGLGLGQVMFAITSAVLSTDSA